MRREFDKKGNEKQVALSRKSKLAAYICFTGCAKNEFLFSKHAYMTSSLYVFSLTLKPDVVLSRTRSVCVFKGGESFTTTIIFIIPYEV